MKMQPEEKTAISLKREYDFFMKLSSRTDAPKIEMQYYRGLAENTARKIDWRWINKAKKEQFVEEYS